MEKPIYFINVETRKKNTAGSKAPEDISNLCRQRGLKQLSMPMFPSDKFVLYQKLWLFFVCTISWLKIKKSVENNSIVFYQFPIYGIRVAKRFIPRIKREKGCKFIALIHDLETLRKGINGVTKTNMRTAEISDSALLEKSDMIICHNSHMKRYLMEQGFDDDKLVELEMFDYLYDGKRVQPQKGDIPSIAIAGNLAEGKCAYIYKIFGEMGTENQSLIIHLYGNNYQDSCANKKMIYHGSFLPEELPLKLEGDFGLVWDGPSAETCAGNTGEYLKYNNPHKASLYLAANMPIVVWREAAVADFVIEHGVGIVVNSLYELQDKIENISTNEYALMCKNASEIGSKIRDGQFFNAAFDKCLNELSK